MPTERPRPQPPAGLPSYVTDPIERQDPEALEAIAEYVDELLAYHRAIENADLDEDDLADDEEDLVDVEERGSGAIVTKKVPCGKETCSTCPHGPYRYRVTRDGDTVNWEYLGRADVG